MKTRANWRRRQLDFFVLFAGCVWLDLHCRASFCATAVDVGSRQKIADSTGAELTGHQLLMRTLVLRRFLVREILAADETYVGVLLPSSAAGVVVNAALPLARRIAVNLNYTLSANVMNNCIKQCGIRARAGQPQIDGAA